MQGRYALDKDNGKLMGVCAGLARSSGVDVTIMRLLTIMLALTLGPLIVLLYIAAGAIAPEQA